MRSTVTSDRDGCNRPSLVMHIIHRLGTGGLENGLVNLINHTPEHRFRHAIVCLTDFTSFRDRIQRKDVLVISLNKREGHDIGVYTKVWQLLHRLKPDIVHTRNLSALEFLVLARLAKVPARVHGEHGRDVYDPDGLSQKYKLLRKAVKPFVHHYTAVSADLADWLVATIGIEADRVTRICNGVDVEHFRPRLGPRVTLGPAGFSSAETMVIGAVGRMETIKDQLTLVHAFLHLIRTEADARKRLRLAIVGDGSLREKALRQLETAEAAPLAWLPGERNDIAELLRGFDLFVLPSLREGMSNTILEAMASGLPVIATKVGGNLELVEQGKTGILVAPADPLAMAEAIRMYLADPSKLVCHGRAGRQKAEAKFSIESMVNGYLAVYDAVLAKRRRNGRKLSRDGSGASVAI